MPIPFAALIPAIAGIAGGLFNRSQSRLDIQRQNMYNSPINQVKRTREAGLPMAAMGNNVSSQQSSLPQTTDLGLSNIGNYATTNKTLMEIQALTQDIRSKKVAADKDEAILTWLQELRGEDRQGTNLTGNLKIQQEASEAQKTGQEISNSVARINETYLDSEKILSREKLIRDLDLQGLHIKGAEAQNKITDILAQYREDMSAAELSGLLKRNGLLDENIIGADLDNKLATIRNRIAEATESAEVNSKNIGAMLAALSYDRVGAEFKNYQQYQEFVDATQDILRDPSKQGMFKTMDALVKFLYTSIASPSGQVSGSILQGIGGGSGGTFNEQVNKYYHIHND